MEVTIELSRSEHIRLLCGNTNLRSTFLGAKYDVCNDVILHYYPYSWRAKVGEKEEVGRFVTYVFAHIEQFH